jgi:hypothetical protein
MLQVIPILALGLESKSGTMSLGFRKKRVAKVSCKLWRGVRSFGRINVKRVLAFSVCKIVGILSD